METKKLLNKAFAMLLALVMVVTLVPAAVHGYNNKNNLEKRDL